ncbi:methyltransferase, FxLD system [Lentzea californiensis]|uniref:methyltransferase, FxLD system n=1 Tax=Lentzea californiensis TaxID=438851 RepID=UPI00216621A3|nr:methyltransferase, FxLD system [Lentzea californiensis]MCR3753710.1 protein-L-isoaspartate(D-aspartate) O-methyltransferase [Lentzea californiensis]
MNATTDTTPEALRAAMVDRIKKAGHARTPAVEQVLRTIPRHRFVPEATTEDAYANVAVITKRDNDGTPLSCASVPTVVAMQLDQLDVQPGHNVLEIGAGTGYNAALLAEQAGPTGHVTTVDIDPEVTSGARRALDENGFRQVEVITRDGSLGAPENAPYDRIVVTVGAFDIPAAWRDQLKPGGRLIVPLRWRGQTRSVAFVRDGDVLVSDSVRLCGFVPMIGQDNEVFGNVDAAGHVTLYWDSDQDTTLVDLYGVLSQPKTPVWSGVTVEGEEPFDGIWLRMTGTEPGTCRIAADATAVAEHLCNPAIRDRSPALVEGSSLAYLTYRRVDGGAELGAIGHGPAAQQLAERFCHQIRAWANARTFEPVITACPADTSRDQVDVDRAITKRWAVLTVSV